jgi:hypothetical protein
MSLRVRFTLATSSSLYYEIDFYGVPHVKGTLGFLNGKVLHVFEFLHQTSIDHYITLRSAITLVEKRYCEQGLNLLAIVCEQVSKVSPC